MDTIPSASLTKLVEIVDIAVSLKERLKLTDIADAIVVGGSSTSTFVLIEASVRESGTSILSERSEILVVYVSKVIGLHGPQVKSVGPQSHPYLVIEFVNTQFFT